MNQTAKILDLMKDKLVKIDTIARVDTTSDQKKVTERSRVTRT